jgi:hypothetical protein
MASSTTTTRERRSFQDLARMAGTPPPPSVRPPVSSPPSGVVRATEAGASDSGVVDLKAAAASDPMAASRAQTTPLASQPLFDDDDARSSQPPVSRNSQAPLSAPAMSGAVASAVLAAAQPVSARQTLEKGTKKRGSALLLVGGIATIAAMAAGAFFVVKSQQAKHAAQTVAIVMPTAAEPAPAPAPQPATTPAPDPTTAAAPVVAALGDDDSKTDDATKGAVGGAKAARPAVAAPAPKKGASGPHAMAKADPADKPDKTDKIDPKLVAKDLPAAPGPTGALADAIKQSAAATPTPPAPTPASQDTAPAPTPNDPAIAAGSVPQKPSQGAVTGAVGAALPAARACLKPDEPVSRAAITFGSNGSVSSVVVTGNAAGKPAEACIKAALSKAKVPAFAMPTYSANVTVRPTN